MESSNVRAFGSVLSMTGLDNEEAVKMLRDLLQKAERGEIKSVLYFAERFDQSFDVAWTGCDDLIQLSGQIARLQHRTQIRLDEAI